MYIYWIAGLSAAGAVCLLASAVIFITIKLKRRKTASSNTDYVTISTGLNSKVTSSCYSTEYVQYPHKQPLERTSTIPFELPMPPSNTLPSPAGAENTAFQPSSRGSLSVADGPQINTSLSSYCLGAIDPELYQMDDDENMIYDFPDNHIGRLWFSVEYKPDTERLLVTILRARNLRTRSLVSDTTCDSYVRVQLMPEKRRVLQTKLKKRTLNPNYDESFVFQVSSKDLDERTLKLTVFHVNRHRKHMMIGQTFYPLREHPSLDKDEIQVFWRDLEREAEIAGEKGELLVSLCYHCQQERITVGVYEAKEWCGGDHPADFYCKINLLQQSRIVKTKRTDVIKKTSEPVFNESFTFKLSSEHLDMTSVSIQAMQHFIGHKDKCIGRITLGPFMFARGKELSHWNEMIANPKEQISNFHKLS